MSYNAQVLQRDFYTTESCHICTILSESFVLTVSEIISHKLKCMLLLTFLARLFSEKTRGIAIALASALSSSSCKSFGFLSYLCNYRKYILETRNICSLSKEQPIVSREITLIHFCQTYALFFT